MTGLTNRYRIKLNDNLSLAERQELSPFIFKAFSTYLDYSNEDVEELVKSVKDKKSSKIWKPHTFKPQADLEDWYYVYLAEPLAKFQNAVLEVFDLGVKRETLKKGLPKYDSGDIDIVDSLMDKYFPSPIKNRSMAEAIAVRSHLIGLIREGESLALPYKTVNVLKLPKTIDNAMKLYKVKEPVARSIIFSKDFAGSLIQTQLDKVKQETKRIILDSYKNNLGTNKIRQRLFDSMGGNNRDWRRIALTEVSYGDSNGYIDSIGHGEWVIGFSSPDACEYCKDLIHGKIYQKSDGPGDWDTHIWTGKTNYDRFASHFTKSKKTGKWVKRADDLIWKPTIPLHPHCRCNWGKFHPEGDWIDDKGFARMKQEDTEAWEQWYEQFSKRKVS